MLSGWLIFLAMIFDALDGHVARLSRATSDFGGQLDSLSDVVSFGVAPGFLLGEDVSGIHVLAQPGVDHRRVVCRLRGIAPGAVQRRDDEEDDHMHFNGLPSPAAGAAIAGFALLFYELRREGNNLLYAHEIDSLVQTVLPFFALLVALLMVSRIPYPHVVNQMLRGQRSFGHIVALLFAAVAIMSIHAYSVPLLASLFVVWRRCAICGSARSTARKPKNRFSDLAIGPPKPAMFTGIVQYLAAVRDVRSAPPGKRLEIDCPALAAEAALGDSIAINGCCLTVVAHGDGGLTFEAGPETLERSNLGALGPAAA